MFPDKVHYPETWFHFIGSNVSLEGITADLEAIAEAGISGVQFFHGPAKNKALRISGITGPAVIRY